MGLKQEQESATDEIVEVAPGILRMQLPVEFTGLGHVNMYGLLDDHGLAVVDPGLPGPTSWEAIESRLADAGYTIDDIHTVVVTHSHPDHFGGAGRIAELSGARLVTQADFEVPWLPQTAPDVAELSLADEPVVATPPPHTPWGTDFVPPAPKERITDAMGAHERWAFRAPIATDRLADGAVVKLAGREWFALHTPGHTHDHLCLHDPTEGVLLAGDHVLPTITPHISGMTGADALRVYLAALEKVAALDDVDLVLPAHGHPFADVAGRVDAIARHHDERLERVREIADGTGPASVKVFSEHLFREDHWGLMAESETYAHLEHLRLDGEARSQMVEGQLVYTVERR